MKRFQSFASYSSPRWKKRAASYDLSDQVQQKNSDTEETFNYSTNIIKFPIVTEKSDRLSEQNQYTFAVTPKATKKKIKVILENVYNIKINSVNTALRPPKKRRGQFKGQQNTGSRATLKKAIVKVAEGSSLSFY
jgi:large subunit ribosomal protein L23